MRAGTVPAGQAGGQTSAGSGGYGKSAIRPGDCTPPRFMPGLRVREGAHKPLPGRAFRDGAGVCPGSLLRVRYAHAGPAPDRGGACPVLRPPLLRRRLVQAAGEREDVPEGSAPESGGVFSGCRLQPRFFPSRGCRGPEMAGVRFGDQPGSRRFCPGPAGARRPLRGACGPRLSRSFLRLRARQQRPGARARSPGPAGGMPADPEAGGNPVPLGPQRPGGQRRSRQVPLQGGPSPRSKDGHLFFFSRDALRVLFRACGFAVVETHTYGIRRGLRALGLYPRKPGWKNPYRPQAPSPATPEIRLPAAPGRLPGYDAYRFRQARLKRLPGLRAFGLDFEIILRAEEGPGE